MVREQQDTCVLSCNQRGDHVKGGDREEERGGVRAKCIDEKRASSESMNEHRSLRNKDKKGAGGSEKRGKE